MYRNTSTFRLQDTELLMDQSHANNFWHHFRSIYQCGVYQDDPSESSTSVSVCFCVLPYTVHTNGRKKEFYPPPSSIFSTCHNGRPRGDMSPQKRDTPKRMNTKRKRRKGNSLWRARNVDVASDKFGTWDTITVRVWHLGSCGFIPTNPLHLLLSCNWTEYIELSWLIIQWRFRN